MSGAPDFFYREAQRLGYVARSAFKVLLPPSSAPLYISFFFSFSLPLFTLNFTSLSRLSLCACVMGQEQLLQMQKQYKLITPGSSVLDLGCAPGAWLQVLNSKLLNGF